MKLFFALMLFVSVAFATEGGFLPDFNYQIADITTKGVKKELLFKKMERSSLDLHNSICANRAHLWAYDMFRNYGVQTGKIFIFFGESIWEGDNEAWMYHVAPYIVENGKEFVMEASYDDILKPLTIHEWIENETYDRVKGSDCLEITAEDKDLTEYFYARYNLPEKRGAGKKGARCYIRKVPGFFWFPGSVAEHDFNKFNPKSFDINDVLDACSDAMTTRLGRVFGGAREKCKDYLNF